MESSLTKEGQIPGRMSYPFVPRLEVTQSFLRGQRGYSLASRYAKAASVLLWPLLGQWGSSHKRAVRTQKAEAVPVLSCQTEKSNERFLKLGVHTEHFAGPVSSFVKENSILPTSWGIVRTQ